jgi:hypothetical protein
MLSARAAVRSSSAGGAWRRQRARREEFPTLSLALIHKTIAFYLENRAETDAYVARCRDEIEGHAAAAPRGPGLVELRRRLASVGPPG